MGTYASVQGDEELREMLSGHLREHHRLQLSPAELLITSGAQQAIDLIAGIMLVRWIRCLWSGRRTVRLWDIFLEVGSTACSG